MAFEWTLCGIMITGVAYKVAEKVFDNALSDLIETHGRMFCATVLGPLLVYLHGEWNALACKAHQTEAACPKPQCKWSGEECGEADGDYIAMCILALIVSILAMIVAYMTLKADDMIDVMFKEMDKNGDGQVSFQEFSKFIRNPKLDFDEVILLLKRDSDDVEQIFRNIAGVSPSNDLGKKLTLRITKDQLVKYYSSLNAPPTPLAATPQEIPADTDTKKELPSTTDTSVAPQAPLTTTPQENPADNDTKKELPRTTQTSKVFMTSTLSQYLNAHDLAEGLYLNAHEIGDCIGILAV